MAETWISSKLYINDGSGGERLVHYETDTKNIVDFEQAVNDIINNSFSNPTFYGTVSIDNLHVSGTSQLDGDVTCNSNLSVHGTINIADQGVISSNNNFTRLSSKKGSYIDLKENGGWEIVSKKGNNVYSILSESSDGNLTYDGNVTIAKNLKVNGNIISPIKLTKATLSSDNSSTKLQTTYSDSSSVALLSNGDVQINVANDHTFVVKHEGYCVMDGKPLLTAEQLFEIEHPILSVYITTEDTNPNTIFGYGTWVKIGGGLQLGVVGTYKDSNSTSHTISKLTNQGEWSHAMTTDELVKHNHKMTCSKDKVGKKIGEGHSHDKGSYRIQGKISASTEHYVGTVEGCFYAVPRGATVGAHEYVVYGVGLDTDRGGWSGRSGVDGIHTHDVTAAETGGTAKMPIVNPTFGIYLWQRTA